MWRASGGSKKVTFRVTVECDLQNQVPRNKLIFGQRAPGGINENRFLCLMYRKKTATTGVAAWCDHYHQCRSVNINPMRVMIRNYFFSLSFSRVVARAAAI